jgi:hypothetical protein
LLWDSALDELASGTMYALARVSKITVNKGFLVTVDTVVGLLSGGSPDSFAASAASLATRSATVVILLAHNNYLYVSCVGQKTQA